MSAAGEFRPHYSVNEYRMWEGDWELWNGVPVAMTPSPFGPHSRLLVDVSFALKSAVNSANCNATVLAEIDWIVDEHTVLRPDIAVVCGREPERHLEQAPAIVVEILSATTRERDLTYKRSLYEEQQVPYYLIVDPGSSVQPLRLVQERYVKLAAAESLQIDICDTCHLELDLSQLFA